MGLYTAVTLPVLTRSSTVLVTRLARWDCFAGQTQCRRHASSSSPAKVQPVFLNIIRQGYGARTAIVDALGRHSYAKLVRLSTALARRLVAVAPRDPAGSRRGSAVVLNGERAALLCPNNAAFAVALLAAWMAGATAVPLCRLHPLPELDYVVRDSQSSVVIATEDYAEKARALADSNGAKLIMLSEEALADREDASDDAASDDEEEDARCRRLLQMPGDWEGAELIPRQALAAGWSRVRWRSRRALLLYTSGTTGPPKGVALTFAALQAQLAALLQAWAWRPADTLLHTLPLHHLHGLVNALLCPLWCGATCVMLPEFSADKVWDKLLDDAEPRVNVFMAVPTIYVKLIERFQARFSGHEVRAFIKATLRDRIRLMVVGSAALPQPVLQKWEEITGHRLLERYGMTELGIALSNPLHGCRVPGAVGNPLTQVEVRIVAGDGAVCVSGTSAGSKVMLGSQATEGELQVRGPGMFEEYWNQPEVTADSFTEDGWFKTGDTALYQDGVYRILGRTSVDIIKSGGYKISALDVERHLLAHPAVAECVVLGVADVTWGQRVAAVVVLRPGPSGSGPEPGSLSLPELRGWARDRMAPYIIPTELRVVASIARNAMGKINKKKLLVEIFEAE